MSSASGGGGFGGIDGGSGGGRGGDGSPESGDAKPAAVAAGAADGAALSSDVIILDVGVRTLLNLISSFFRALLIQISLFCIILLMISTNLSFFY